MLNSNLDSLNAQLCAFGGYDELLLSRSSPGTVPAKEKRNPPPPKEPCDPIQLGHGDKSLLDSGKFENSDYLARYLGVSRASVTHVLSRLSLLAVWRLKGSQAKSGYCTFIAGIRVEKLDCEKVF